MRSLESVSAQSFQPSRVLIATHARFQADVLRICRDFPGFELLVDEQSHLGGHLRDVATRSSVSEAVAYLDDDDYWLPGKLEEQRSALAEDVWMVSCQSGDFMEGAFPSGAYPERTYDGAEDLSEWLFWRRPLSKGRNTLPTSTLLVRTEIAKTVGWRRDLRRHQDWDFLLRSAGIFGRKGIRQLNSVLVARQTGGADSVSAGTDFAESVRWLDSVREEFTPRAAADFLVGQPARYAVTAYDFCSAATIVRRAFREDRPSWRSFALCGSGLLPRRRFERTLARQSSAAKDGGSVV